MADTSYGDMELDFPVTGAGILNPNQSGYGGKNISIYAKGMTSKAIYAVVFMDAIHFHVRSEGCIIKKTDYITIGIDLSGGKDVLGMYVGENESTKFCILQEYKRSWLI